MDDSNANTVKTWAFIIGIIVIAFLSLKYRTEIVHIARSALKPMKKAIGEGENASAGLTQSQHHTHHTPAIASHHHHK